MRTTRWQQLANRADAVQIRLRMRMLQATDERLSLIAGHLVAKCTERGQQHGCHSPELSRVRVRSSRCSRPYSVPVAFSGCDRESWPDLCLAMEKLTKCSKIPTNGVHTMNVHAIHNLLLAATLGLGALVQSASAADKVTYQLDWLPGGDKSPVYVGVEKGFFEEAGLDVSIASGRGSTDAITKIATGQADIGSADIGALMAAKAQDDSLPVKVVYTMFNQAPHAFFTLKSSGMKTVTDVDGKRVATSPFTSSNAFLPLVLRENGLAEDAVKLTKADPGALGPMLMTGGTDAIIAWVTNVPLYTDQAEATGNELVVIPWSDAGLELYSSSLVASEAFLNDRPDVAKRFIKAFDKSLRYTNENPRAAAEALKSMVPEVDVDVAEAQVGATMQLVFNDVSERDGIGAMTPERVSKTWNWVHQAEGLSEDSLEPEKIVDRTLVETLK